MRVSILNGKGHFYPPALDTLTVRRHITEIRNLSESLAPAGMSPTEIRFGFGEETPYHAKLVRDEMRAQYDEDGVPSSYPRMNPQCVFHWEGREATRTITVYPHAIHWDITAPTVSKKIPVGEVVEIDNGGLEPEVLGPFDVEVTFYESRGFVNEPDYDPYDEQTSKLRGLANRVLQLEAELRG